MPVRAHSLLPRSDLPPLSFPSRPVFLSSSHCLQAVFCVFSASFSFALREVSAGPSSALRRALRSGFLTPLLKKPPPEKNLIFLLDSFSSRGYTLDFIHSSSSLFFFSWYSSCLRSLTAAGLRASSGGAPRFSPKPALANTINRRQVGHK